MADQTDPTNPDPTPLPTEVDDLLGQQAQLQGGLQSLQEQSAGVPERVTARVRGDYEARLREVVDRLAGHQDAIRADLDRLRAEHQTALAQYEDAGDRLEEYRLRHRIGELDDAEWGARRADLEQEVEQAGSATAAADAEVQRLEALLRQFQPEAAEPAPAEPEETFADPMPTEAEPVAAPAEESRPDLPFEWEVDSSSLPPEDDLDFLTGLDRAISTPAGSEAGSTVGADSGETEAETRPRPGAKCPECGYTNDSTAWYCGVCGVDLA